MKPLIIFGCASFAQVAKCYFTEDSPYEVVAFTVDREYLSSSTLLGLEVIPFEDLAQRYPPDSCELFVAIGYSRVNHARAEVYDRCKRLGYRLANYVSSTARVWGPVTLGDNTFVQTGCHLQPLITLGNNLYLGPYSIIGHHSIIEDHCFIEAQSIVAGRTRIGHHTFLGLNATVINDLTVGAENIVDAGVTLTRNTGDREVYRAAHPHKFDIPSTELWK